MSIALEENFQPGNWDVICGRGRHSYTHVGNRRFRIAVANNFRQYVEAETLQEKMDLVQRIHDIVSGSYGGSGGSNSYNDFSSNARGGSFVKQDADGRWYELDHREIKKKISHTFRDYMKGPLRRRNNCTPEEREIAIQEAETEIIRSCGLIGTGTNNHNQRK